MTLPASIPLILFCLLPCSGAQAEPTALRSDFDSLTDWRDDSSRGSPKSYSLEDGKLEISTRPDTKDRVKVATRRRFGAGTYTWRIYIPTLGQGDQSSIGAFLYRDDKHEVDFEIGYGKEAVRKKANAKADELVCYCTSQGHPYSTTQTALKRERWYTFSIELKEGANGNYLIRWLIDQKEVKTLNTTIKSNVDFTVHCSVENLSFMGEHLPKIRSWAKFDSFQFDPPDTTTP